MVEKLPYESRKWMCRDLSSVDEEADEDGPWYDAIIVKFLSTKSSSKSKRVTSLRDRDVLQVHTHFVGYPKDEDQNMDFTDENCVEHNDPRYSWSYDSKGAWLRKPSGRPLTKFGSIPISTSGRASKPSSAKTTSKKKRSSSSSTTRKTNKAKKSTKSTPTKHQSSVTSTTPFTRTQPTTKFPRQWSNLVNPVQLQGTRRIGVWNPQEISVQAIQLHYNRTSSATTQQRQDQNWNGSWGFRSGHVLLH